MLEGGQPEKPVITVFSCGDAEVERQVLAGIEEEGVPSDLCRRDVRAGTDAQALAADAARTSPLDVGVGIGQYGDLCIHHEKFTSAIDGLSVAAGDPDILTTARIAGHNAARLVVGIPLRKLRR